MEAMLHPVTTYKLLVQDKSYFTYKFLNTDTNEDVPIDLFPGLDPLREKMFSKDVFSYDIEKPTQKHSIVYSHIKSGINIAGVLILENNKTFGRTANKKRLLYKCIPDDKHLPIFLIPYDLPVGFSKTFVNKYVLFKYESWNNVHPQGILVDTLGDVNDPTIFYEYQLYCKSLHVSLAKFTNKAKEQIPRLETEKTKIQSILQNPDFSIEDRRMTHRVFTIDPKNSADFDDGFSIYEDPATGIITLSIYIANVFFWLETLGLWESFSSRVATIYLPDRKRPMLPTILSDNLCSLQEDQTRFTFTMDLFWKKREIDTINNISNINEYELIDTKFTNTVINVFKNYRYEESDLLYNCPDYSRLFEFTQIMDKSCTDSHDIVTFWMTFMNKTCGEVAASKGIGIFRSAIYKNKLVYEETERTLSDISNISISPDCKRVITTWNNTAGQYVVFDKNPEKNISTEHEVMKTKSYIHITSPIRRLVDLLNMYWLSRELGLLKTVSAESCEFFQSWISKIDYINESMRAIRKIQTDCEMIHRCYTSPHILDSVYEGTVFGKLVKNDGAILYMVYLDSIGILSRMTIHTDIPNYSRGRFKIFLFEDEDRMRKKIRLHLVEVC
jgi:exoribonuclease R